MLHVRNNYSTTYIHIYEYICLKTYVIWREGEELELPTGQETLTTLRAGEGGEGVGGVGGFGEEGWK